MMKQIKIYLLKNASMHWVVLIYIWFRARIRSMYVSLDSRNDESQIVIRRGNDSVIISKRHLPYGLDVVLNFDYFHGSIRPTVIAGVNVADFSGVRLHTLRHSGKQFWFSSFPETEITINLYLANSGLTQGAVVIDCGAYCGVSAVFFSEAVGSAGQVIALEPDPDNYKCLQKNLAHHQSSNVVALSSGIWSRTGVVQFQAEGNLGSSVNEFLEREGKVIAVKVVSFDQLVVDYDLKRVDFIKLDIEGAEIEVIRGSELFLKKHRPVLVIEAHFVAGKLTTNELVRLLTTFGYIVSVLPQAKHELPLLVARARE